MFCNKCGRENPDDSKFCNYCGNSFNHQSNIRVKGTQKKKNIIIAIISIFLICAAGVTLFIVYNYNNSLEVKNEVGEIKNLDEDANKEYFEKIKLCSDSISTKGSEAIEICQTITSVWSTAINKGWSFNEVFNYMFSGDLKGHEWSGVGMDKYGFNIISWGSLAEKMNSFNDTLNEFIPSKEEINSMILDLGEPPQEFATEYDLLVEYYSAFVELYDCAVNPSGTYQNYSLLFEQKKSNFNSIKSKIDIKLN